MFKKSLFLALAVLLVVSLAACGGAPTENASAGNALRVGWTSEIDTMNPFTSFSTEALQPICLVYEPLITYGTDLEPVHKLAESFEYSEDGCVVTYHLRQDVKWHDGEPFTSADVVGTYNLILDTQLGHTAQYTQDLESVTAPDDYTVEMKFSQPQAFNLAYTAVILPMHIWGGMSAEDIEAFANEAPVGTGPMKFVEWQQGATLTLERNAEYYGKAPGPDKIIFIQYGNEDVLVQALKAGEIDIVTEVSPTVWEGLAGAENVEAVSLPSFSFHMVGINCNQEDSSKGNPMLLDKTVRQALSYAMDRGQITEIALAGHGSPGTTIIPDGMKEWQYQLPAEEIMDNDIEKAKTILEEAGYVDSDGDGIREKDGEPMEFRIMAIESTSVDVRAAQLFRDSAEKAGIKLELTTMDENTMGDIIFDMENTDFDLFVWGWDADYADPGYMLGIPLTSEIGNNNDVYYSNPEYDALYLDQAKAIDNAERKSVVDKMQKIYYNDAAYLILWNQDKLQAYRTDTWTGWVEVPSGLIYGVCYENYLNVQPAAAE